MPATFQLKLVTPAGTVLEEDIEEITLATLDGQIGIMANHEPLVSILKPGEMIVRSGAATTALATAGGVIEMAGNTLTILADTAEHASQIELERAEKTAEELAEQLSRGEQMDLTTYKTLQRQLEKEQARISVFKKWRK